MNKVEKINAFDPSGVGLKNGHFIGLPFKEADAELVLLPIPWDVTVSYADGTASASKNILKASAQLDLYDADIADAWKLGVYMRKPDQEIAKKSKKLREKAIDYIAFVEEGEDLNGNESMQRKLKKINDGCAEMVDWVYETTKSLLEQGKLVGLVGGDHSTPLGYLKSLAEKHDDFGIIQIDAHQDLRDAYEGFTYSHASIFFNALKINQIKKLVQVGIRDNCQAEMDIVAASMGRLVVFTDQYLQEQAFLNASWSSVCKQMINHLPQKVYISFDIDGLNPNLCPNTGTPVPGGLEFAQVIYLIKNIVQSGRTIIGFDLSEVGGEGNEWDGNVAARLLYKLCNFTGRSNGKI
jgi:agmatinase